MPESSTGSRRAVYAGGLCVPYVSRHRFRRPGCGEALLNRNRMNSDDLKLILSNFVRSAPNLRNST
jgi:hypothetical protein